MVPEKKKHVAAAPFEEFVNTILLLEVHPCIPEPVTWLFLRDLLGFAKTSEKPYTSHQKGKIHLQHNTYITCWRTWLTSKLNPDQKKSLNKHNPQIDKKNHRDHCYSTVPPISPSQSASNARNIS